MIDPYVPERGNPGYDASRYELQLDYAVSTNRLAGRARIHVVPTGPLERLSLDLVRLRVVRVTIAGRAARWQHRSGKLHIVPDRPLVPGRDVIVDIRYEGNPVPANTRWGAIGWEELSDGVLVASQPSGASTWFPCNDLARQKASFAIEITVPSSYLAIATGALRSKRVRGSTTTYSYEQDEPTSPYLVAVHVGRYETHIIADAPIPITAVTASAQRHAHAPAFDRLPMMMKSFVGMFGPYPLRAGYTVVVCPELLDIPVEAQGMAAFGTNHLDAVHERLVAHELAHQWFGNSVTAESWRHTWLHEGFACYAEWLWSEASGDESAAWHARTHHARLRRLPQDLVLDDPGPDDMFDDRVYKRGALTLHEVRSALGDDAFFGLLRLWTKTYRHGVATTDAFIALATKVAGRSLGDLFDSWLRSPRLPALSA